MHEKGVGKREVEDCGTALEGILCGSIMRRECCVYIQKVFMNVWYILYYIKLSNGDIHPHFSQVVGRARFRLLLPFSVK